MQVPSMYILALAFVLVALSSTAINVVTAAPTADTGREDVPAYGCFGCNVVIPHSDS
jgi:hypothetical protein